MNARSALFDLYGDHLRTRGGQAPVAALVRLLAPLGIAAPAVRTAVSRMVRQGWLEPVRLPDGPGYALTPRAVRRVDDASRRIYRTSQAEWDGTWHLVVTEPVPARTRRERLRAGMTFLGYGQLDSSTWIGPRASEEVSTLLAAEQANAERFTARHDGDALVLVRRAWDLESLAGFYSSWLESAKVLSAEADSDATDEQAFAVRSRLLHEWRKFLFVDPGLPAALLPPGWVGQSAAAFFDQESTRLLPAALRYVDSCLTAP